MRRMGSGPPGATCSGGQEWQFTPLRDLWGRQVLVLAGAAFAPGAATAASPFDHVVGGGQNNPPNPANPIAHFQINVKSGPNGENPKGSFTFTRTVDGPPTESFSATVTCMRGASGNLATVVGPGRSSEERPLPLEPVLHRPAQGRQPGETAPRNGIQNGVYLGNPYQCPDPIEPRPDAITHGNINVFDAS